MNPNLWPRGRALARRAGEHKVVSGAASTVLAATVLGAWGVVSGWVGGGSPTAQATTVAGPAGPVSTGLDRTVDANFEPLGFGTDFGPDDLPGGRRAAPGQTLQICRDEPLIGWFLHDLAAGSSLRLRWLHEGETIRVETYEVSTAATWYRVGPPVATGQYSLEAQTESGEEASWSVYAQTLDPADAACVTAEASATAAP